MTKQELIEAVAKKVGTSKAQVGEVLNALLEEIKKTLSKGKEVTLTGFGTFKVVKRKARTGRNPKTGEEIKIPAQKVPRFKPGKALKEAVK